MRPFLFEFLNYTLKCLTCGCAVRCDRCKQLIKKCCTTIVKHLCPYCCTAGKRHKLVMWALKMTVLIACKISQFSRNLQFCITAQWALTDTCCVPPECVSFQLVWQDFTGWNLCTHPPPSVSPPKVNDKAVTHALSCHLYFNDDPIWLNCFICLFRRRFWMETCLGLLRFWKGAHQRKVFLSILAHCCAVPVVENLIMQTTTGHDIPKMHKSLLAVCSCHLFLRYIWLCI